MNNTNLYLDLYGLHYYNEKLKKYVDDKEVKTDDVTISKNASGELEVTGHLKRLIDNVYVPRPLEIAIITGVKITGDSNNITITGGTLELPEGSISSLEFSTTSGFISELKTSGIKFPNSGVINNATLENTTVSGDLNFTLGNIINPSTILGVDNITFNNLGDITFSGKTLINQNSISTETVDAEYLLAGDTSTNRCAFISSEGISFIPTGMQISPTTISGVDNILMNSGTISGVSNINLEENSNISGVNNVSLASNSGLVLKYNGIKAFTGEVSSAEVSVENTLRIRTGYNNRGKILEKIVFDTPNTGVLDMNGGTITGINQIKIGTGPGIVIDSNTIGMSNYSGEISFLSDIRLNTGGTLNITNGILEIKEEVTDVTGSSRALHFINNSGNSNSIVIHKSGIVAGSDYVNGSSINHFGEGVHFASKVHLYSGFTATGNIWISGITSGDTSLISIDNIITERLSLTGSSEFNVNSGTISELGTLNMVSGGDINMNNSTMKSGNIINSTIINNIYDGTNNTFTNDFINLLKIALGIN